MRYITKVLSIERRCRTMFGRFNRRPGDSPEEANWEGWTPPWMSGEGRGPRGPFGLDVDLAARAAHLVLDMAGTALVVLSAQASVLVGSGACPMKCWRCVLRPRR